MQEGTKKIIQAALDADVSIPSETSTEIKELLSGRQRELPTETLLMSIPEACAALRCSRQTVWRLVKDGELSPVRLRGLVRFRRMDIEELAGRAGGGRE